MKIAILGAGVIGVTTAHYLARQGHEVTVIDRQSGPALETSFANAGQVSPGYSAPWAAPSIPVKAMKWLLMRHAPLIIRPQLDMAMIRWTLAMLRNCTHARYALNKGRMVRLAEYSRDQLDLLRRQTGIAYDGREQGTLQLFRTEKQLADVHKDVDVLRAHARFWTPQDASLQSRVWPRQTSPSSGACACRTTRRATVSCSPTSWRNWRRNRAWSSTTASRFTA